MSEAYWIGGLQVSYTEGEEPGGYVESLFTRLISDHGIRLTWLDELHYCYNEIESHPLANAWEKQISSSMPVFQWGWQRLFDHFLLASVTNSILCGSTDLVGLIQLYGGTIACSLLASPRMVGRYNIVPQVRLILNEAVSFQEQDWDGILLTIRQTFRRYELDFDLISIWMVNEENGIEWNIRNELSGFDIVRADQGSFYLLNQLANLTLEKPQTYGLLLSMGQDRNGFLTVMERI
jgi:hypothetical protein